jgi:DNA-binding IscR family transcriptional regulator
VNGGYVMNRPASAMTLGEVVRALGRLESTEHICQSFTGQLAACIHFSNCGIRSVWSGLTSYIQSFLDQTTLADVLPNEYAVSARLAKRVNP